jgi:hypothetical protein
MTNGLIPSHSLASHIVRPLLAVGVFGIWQRLSIHPGFNDPFFRPRPPFTFSPCSFFVSLLYIYMCVCVYVFLFLFLFILFIYLFYLKIQYTSKNTIVKIKHKVFNPICACCIKN